MKNVTFVLSWAGPVQKFMHNISKAMSLSLSQGCAHYSADVNRNPEVAPISTRCLHVSLCVWVLSQLTIIAIASEELMKSDEIRASPEVSALGDEHLLDEIEVVDDHTLCGPESDAEHIAVLLAERRERLEGRFVRAQQM